MGYHRPPFIGLLFPSFLQVQIITNILTMYNVKNLKPRLNRFINIKMHHYHELQSEDWPEKTMFSDHGNQTCDAAFGRTSDSSGLHSFSLMFAPWYRGCIGGST